MDELVNGQQPAPEKSGIVREAPDVEPARSALVKEWEDRVIQAKAHWKKAFDRMRRNMKFVSGKQWPNQTDDDDRYVANIVQRIVKTSVSAAYAKNPTVVHQTRKRLDFELWDGKPESAMQAMSVIQSLQTLGQPDPVTGMVAPPPDPMMVQQAGLLVQDIAQGTQRKDMIRKVGETLTCLAEYYISEGKPSFKLQMKQLVRRVRTTGVGYVQIGFQRAMELSEEQNNTLEDYAQRLARIGQIDGDIQDGETAPTEAEAEEMRLAIEAIKASPEVIVREGVTFSFPRSTKIIPSPNTEALMGWVGTDWLAEEVMMTVDRVKQVYDVDVGKSYTAYKAQSGASLSAAMRKTSRDAKDAMVCVWRIFDKNSGLELTIAEGYPDFLKEPAAPSVFVEQFYPYFAVMFNAVEDEESVFPQSDVELLMHVQKEYNRSKEALRQHRIAARPLYLAPSGSFEDEEKKSLADHAAHEVIEIQSLDKGQKAGDVLMPVQKHGVDPNLYETAGLFDDMQRVSGNQEATIGGTGSATATESNIAEGSRQGTLGLDTDDLDEMLTALFGAMGQIMLSELDPETVKEIVGPGAVWPELSRTEIMKELWLGTKAGSSGRPDQQRDAAAFERVAPYLLQIPGVSPRWLGERAVRLVDDDIDISEAILDGLPSILSQNKAAQVAPGDPAAQPDQQGDEGADKNRAPAPGGGDTDSFPAG